MTNEGIQVLDVGDASYNLIEDLGFETHRSRGYMAATLDLCYRMRKVHRKDDFVGLLFIYYIDGGIAGWAIVQDLLYRREDYVDLSIYVNPFFRKQGIGSAIMHSVQETCAPRTVSMWVSDKVNANLFKAFDGKGFHGFDSSAYAEDKSYKRYNFN